MQVRDYITNRFRDVPVDLVDIANYVGPSCKKDYQRWQAKNWDYLSVEAPDWAHWVCWIVTIVANIGLAVLVADNQFTSDNPVSYLSRGRYPY